MPEIKKITDEDLKKVFFQGEDVKIVNVSIKGSNGEWWIEYGEVIVPLSKSTRNRFTRNLKKIKDEDVKKIFFPEEKLVKIVEISKRTNQGIPTGQWWIEYVINPEEASNYTTDSTYIGGG